MKVYKKPMTLSEILFSLTIIGVIAAITLPTLRGNINERTWKAQRKALYSRISQAIPLGGALNGYGIGNDDTQTKTNAAQAFILQRLKKNIQMNNVCEKNKISDFGISSKIFTLNGSQISFPTTMLGLNPLFSHLNNSV